MRRHCEEIGRPYESVLRSHHTFPLVLAETALLTVRRTRIDQLAEEHNRSARLVQRLLAEPTRMLATLQVGLTLVTMFAAGAIQQLLF